ncbi:MAG TPA: folylpolyglutamate synthase/dihydrofolate synthase family protein [Acidobacteriaceae bacterium]|nr:folylpolyglutamate synthase/dihydrofolate synthase family protein [Acidobacteriaceae bacterium]
MSYAAAVEGLFALAGELHAAPGQPRRKFDLKQVRILAEVLGNPQLRFPSVLIAGTNGKGSTSATLSSILQAGGYRTGLYTSPHLTSVNERIRINGEDIRDDDFAAYYFRVDDCARRLVAEGRLNGFPSFFEAMTALAFVAFAEQQVDIAVLEVGMGGRLDATNIVEPLVSVITDISLDHTEWLGGTIAEIAREKAGILRQSGVLITLPQHPEANQAIGEAAVALGVRSVSAAEYIPTRGTEGGTYSVSVLGETIEVASPLTGSHQQRNMALAIATAVELCNYHGYKLTTEQIADGIRTTRWPGRLERFCKSGHADVLFDVAHNPAGAWALRSALSHLDPQPRTMTAVFGCLKDKAIDEMAQILFPMFEMVVLTEVSSPRTATLSQLQAAAVATGTHAAAATSPKAALAEALDVTPPDGVVVVTGSVYLVGELRGQLQESDV